MSRNELREIAQGIVDYCETDERTALEALKIAKAIQNSLSAIGVFDENVLKTDVVALARDKQIPDPDNALVGLP